MRSPNPGVTPLETPRLLLRDLRPEDAERWNLCRLFPEGKRFRRPMNLPQVRRLIARLAEQGAKETEWTHLAIEHAGERRMIGELGFLRADRERKSWVAITLDPNYWKQGFAKEALGAALKRYSEQGVREFHAAVERRDRAGTALCASLGFRFAKDAWPERIFVLANPA